MLISTIYKSILRSAHELIDQIRATTTNQDIQYWAWETRADESELPKVDLFGLSSWGFEENGGLWKIRAGFAVSSYQDAHLLREVETLDVIHKQLGEGNKIPLRDPQTGEIFSELAVAEGSFEIMPMGQSELRNYRTIAIELLKTAN